MRSSLRHPTVGVAVVGLLLMLRSSSSKRGTIGECDDFILFLRAKARVGTVRGMLTRVNTC